MAKNELTVYVDSGEGFRVEVKLDYTPEQLKREKVSEFIEAVKTKYCKAINEREYIDEFEENLDHEKLKKFNYTNIRVEWIGPGSDLKNHKYTKNALESQMVLYDLLDRSCVDTTMPTAIASVELNKLSSGTYPDVFVQVLSK